ncbi:hypothetical protein IAQ67_28940 (plasmid) [Paenibacillus peoriae]|uniref:Uncharacterized protein n=1 Tax=Paenibacillus peoriae TaxID=59893 RepID=A0A7H0YH25_9BACL|nr:hypothetical protein [Paenibacillus peoriae]QNR70383.1 hypothetical protein IAQ67_28940 [Paenibacillus peoriae]
MGSELRSSGFYLKTKEDFDKFKEEKEIKPVNFEMQVRNLIEAGEIIFAELDDGYMAIRRKKGYGLSKGKSELYICTFGEVPQTYRHRDVDSGIRQFSQLHKEGMNFFYVEGLR